MKKASQKTRPIRQAVKVPLYMYNKQKRGTAFTCKFAGMQTLHKYLC